MDRNIDRRLANASRAYAMAKNPEFRSLWLKVIKDLCEANRSQNPVLYN